MSEQSNLADALAHVSREYLASGPSNERQEKFLDTLSLVLMRMLPSVDAGSLDEELKELFQIAMARTGVNELVRSPADFERVLVAFERTNPPDVRLLESLRTAIDDAAA